MIDHADEARALPMRDAVDREWERRFPRASDELEARVAWAMEFLDGQPTAQMRTDAQVAAIMAAQSQQFQGRAA